MGLIYSLDQVTAVVQAALASSRHSILGLLPQLAAKGGPLLERVGFEPEVTDQAKGQVTTECCSRILLGWHHVLNDFDLECSKVGPTPFS